MKKLLTLLMLIFISSISFSQEIEDEEESEDAIFIYVNRMPRFPGGNDSLRTYITENIIYPEQAQIQNIQGTVYLRFVVEKDGSIGPVQLQRGIHELLDKEAIRVIKTLPNFTPGEQNGKRVRAWYSLPIIFK